VQTCAPTLKNWARTPVAPVVVVVQPADGIAEVQVVAVRGDLLVASGNLLYE
jgi:hypothetical protein